MGNNFAALGIKKGMPIFISKRHTDQQISKRWPAPPHADLGPVLLSADSRQQDHGLPSQLDRPTTANEHDASSSARPITARL